MTTFAHPHFAEPHWLWLALLAPLGLVALQQYAAAARRRHLAALAAPDLIASLTRSHSPFRRGLKNGLLLLAAAGIGLALARPQWGVREFAPQSFGEDLVFAVDCSRSMLAADVSPNRLERTKLAMLDFVRRHAQGRVGLIAFSGQAFLQCPLTFDYDAFEDSLQALDEKAVAVPGTDLGRALNEAFQAMERKDRRKILVLLTDGEDLEQSGVPAAAALAKQDVVVFTIGVGTAAGAEIRMLNEQNQPQLVRDSQGEPVRSRLDETTLRSIALATGGKYFPLGPLGEGLARVRGEVESSDAFSGPAAVRQFGVDRYHWIIAGVLLLLVTESLMGTRRRGFRAAHGLRREPAALMTLGLLGFGLVTGEAAGAVETNLFRDFPGESAPEPAPESARECFNAGTRKLRAGKLREAEALFLDSLSRQDDSLQPPALYNLGHVRFGQGEEELRKSPSARPAAARGQAAAERAGAATDQARAALAGNDLQKMTAAYLNGRGARRELKAAAKAVRQALEQHGAALRKWARSLDDFRSAAELNPADTNAQRNAETVERAIARLVDSLRLLQQSAQQMQSQNQMLQQLMKELGGKIPQSMMPPGAEGDDEESDEGEDGEKPEPQAGQQEAPSKDGESSDLSPEEAGWLLEGFKLDGDRHLPMGQGSSAQPKNRGGRDW